MQKIKDARGSLKKKQFREALRLFEEGLNEEEIVKGKVYYDIAKQIIKSAIYDQDNYEKAMELINLSKNKEIKIEKEFELLCYVRIYRETNCLDMAFQKSKELVEQLIFSKNENEADEIITMVSEVIITYICLNKFDEAQDLLSYLNVIDKLIEEELENVVTEDYEESKMEIKKDVLIKMGFGDMIQLIDLKTASVDKIFKNALNEMIEFQKGFALNYKRFEELEIDFNAVNDVSKDETYFQNELQKLVMSYSAYCMDKGVKISDITQYQMVVVEFINYLCKKNKSKILSDVNNDIIFKFIGNDYILQNKNSITNFKIIIASKAIKIFYEYLAFKNWANQQVFYEVKAKCEDLNSLFDRVEKFFILKRAEWKI